MRTRIAQDIADGIYDNLCSFSRERWENGRITGHIDARLLVEQVKHGLPFKAWGHYPDVPRTNLKIKWPRRKVSATVHRVLSALIHSAGDMRSCPNCRHSFVPEDQAQIDALAAHKELKAVITIQAITKV